jgi:hypothetical protein
MNTPIPPTIPSSGQFSNADIGDMKVSINNGTFVSNGFLTSLGGSTIIDTLNPTYTSTEFCKGMIIRSANSGTDTFPNPEDIAATLGLPNVSGIDYLRYISITNLSGGSITFAPGLHTTILYSTRTISNGIGGTYAYHLYFDGVVWQMQMFAISISAIV